MAGGTRLSRVWGTRWEAPLLRWLPQRLPHRAVPDLRARAASGRLLDPTPSRHRARERVNNPETDAAPPLAFSRNAPYVEGIAGTLKGRSSRWYRVLPLRRPWRRACSGFSPLLD